MTPQEIDIPTLNWVADEINKEIVRHKQISLRNEAALSGMSEMEIMIRAVVSRLERGEGLRSTTPID